ncbi:arginine kinase-like [Copidosoma floridanum]|uniref:arginine kinase-like n=1 Tax=Copidosoma floridanum TaxID=29053 RepID=UPI0006C979AF|nr:arginine kinase-like [Copidosoma floridanum]
MCDKSKCCCKKKVGQVDQATLQKLQAQYDEFSKKESGSLLKKHLTREIFDKIKTRKTRFNSSLLDVIQSGLQNPDSGVGLYASDPDAYSVFAPLFDPVIDDYHGGFKPTDEHPARDFGDPASLSKLDPNNKYIISTRVRVARSLENFPFNPTMSKEHYLQIQDKLCKALTSLDGEHKGEYHPLCGMDESTKKQLIDDHYLFKEGDRFLQAARACEHWPIGRGIFFNKDKSLLAWVNEEDHLRLISMQKGGDLAAVFQRLISALCKLEQHVKFSRSRRFGFLTFCPSNLGTTIRASVHASFPKLAADLAKLEEVAGRYNLQVRGTRGEHSESEGGIYDISNKRRLGLTEFQAIEEMHKGIVELIKLEEGC